MIAGGYIVRRIILLMILFLIIFSSTIVFAESSAYSPTVKWVFVPTNTRWSINWYYGTQFTNINDQSQLETWIKDEYTGENNLDFNNGEYTITHYYINTSCNKYLKIEWTIFDKNDKLVKKIDDPNAEWKNIRPGSGFEQCAQAAMLFAKKQ